MVSSSHWAVVCLLCIVVAVGVVECQPKCCMPKQVSAVMTELQTINSNNIVNLFAQWDFDKGLQVLDTMTLDPRNGQSVFNNRTILNFAENILYILPDKDLKTCKKTANPSAPLRCIPEDAQNLGSTYLGALGHGLSYTGYRFTLPKTNLEITLAATADCVPLVEGVRVPQQPKADQLYLFTSFESKIVDPMKMELPESCQ